MGLSFPSSFNLFPGLSDGDGLSIGDGLAFGGFGPLIPPGVLLWGTGNTLEWGTSNFLTWG